MKKISEVQPSWNGGKEWRLSGAGQKCNLAFQSWTQNCNFHQPEKQMCYQCLAVAKRRQL